MPLFDFRCTDCGAVTELLLLRPQDKARCGHCQSTQVVRLISRFSFKASRAAKYSEEFREKTLPFLKSRPGAAELFADGGGSEESVAYKLSEAIGERVDGALDRVIKG